MSRTKNHWIRLSIISLFMLKKNTSSFSLVPTSKHKSLYVIKEIIFNISILNNNDSG